MSNGKQKHILVTILDWGLGHATRSIPIINALLAKQCNVSIAGNGSSLELLKLEFPQLLFHELPSYKITYPSHGFFFLHLLVKSPHIFKAIREEQWKLEKLVLENQVDAIISDNRYGCHSDKVPSILITHQLNIQLPFTLIWSKWLIDRINHRLIKKFDACWVPDLPDSQLSGKLSMAKNLNVKFIGILSRFVPNDIEIDNELILGLVSGPEPQREIFEKRLITEFKKLNKTSVIVRGLPQREKKELVEGNLKLINHASAHELQKIISRASVIVSRSGYSTIMDLYTLGKKRVILVPTPGQTEQEFLSDELERKKIAFSQTQDKLDLPVAVEKSKEYSGFDTRVHRTNLLNEAIQELLNQI